MLRSLAAIAILALASSAFADDKDKPKPNTLTPKEIADGWILLFDGETTFGWLAEPEFKEDKKPELTVKDGALAIKGEMFNLRTTSQFHDCEFSAEYRVSKGQGYVGAEMYTSGKPSGVEMARLVLDDRGEWRPMSVRADRSGSTFIINGKPLPKGPEKRTVSDFVRYGVCFSDILGPRDGETHLELRSVKLRPLVAKPLFNGKNLTGWKINDADPKRMASKWEVTKDGELSVKNGPGDLVTEKEFDNFVLQFECKTLGKALNSGFFFRCIPGQYQNGYEAQIQNAYTGDDRTKPADFGTGAIYRRIPARKVVSNDNEWFTMTVVADGKHIATWVNGYQTVDWTDDRKENENPRQGYRAAKGPISIQGHDPTTDILFRNIRIADLPK